MKSADNSRKVASSSHFFCGRSGSCGSPRIQRLSFSRWKSKDVFWILVLSKYYEILLAASKTLIQASFSAIAWLLSVINFWSSVFGFVRCFAVDTIVVNLSVTLTGTLSWDGVNIPPDHPQRARSWNSPFVSNPLLASINYKPKENWG